RDGGLRSRIVGRLRGVQRIHREVTADAGEQDVRMEASADLLHLPEPGGVAGVVQRRPAFDLDDEADGWSGEEDGPVLARLEPGAVHRLHQGDADLVVQLE